MAGRRPAGRCPPALARPGDRLSPGGSGWRQPLHLFYTFGFSWSFWAGPWILVMLTGLLFLQSEALSLRVIMHADEATAG